MTIPQEHKDKMVEMYLAGYSLEKSVAPFGCSTTACINELKRRNIPRRPAKTQGRKVSLSQEQKDAMVEMYITGHSGREAAIRFGCAVGTCYNELKRRGILRRGFSEAHQQYEIDETFFDIIDTEAKAYWLGFLGADGGVCGNVVSLGLAVKDRKHVAKFLMALKSGHPINERTRDSWGKKCFFAVVTIGNARLSSALQALGVTERKSLTIKPCKEVPKRLLHHYWRGVIDGDGWITSTKSKRSNTRYWTVGLSGSEGMTHGLNAWVKTFMKTKAKVHKYPRKRTFYVNYGGTRKVKALIACLYNDAHIWLDRKHELALAIMKTEIQRQDWSSMTSAKLDALFAEHKTWAATAQAMKTSTSRLRCIHKRLLAQEQSNTAKGI